MGIMENDATEEQNGFPVINTVTDLYARMGYPPMANRHKPDQRIGILAGFLLRKTYNRLNIPINTDAENFIEEFINQFLHEISFAHLVISKSPETGFNTRKTIFFDFFLPLEHAIHWLLEKFCRDDASLHSAERALQEATRHFLKRIDSSLS